MKYQKKLTLDQLRNKILYYINYRIRSQLEVIKKLRTLSATEEEIAILIKELLELNLINDEKFIHYFIRDYFEFKKFSIYRTNMELIKKGFDKYLIQDSLTNYCEQEEFSELDQAFQIVQAKYRNRQSLPDKNKILAFLTRKGFSYSIASKALDQLTKTDLFDM